MSQLSQASRNPAARLSDRILILAPTGKDAELAAGALRGGGLTGEPCSNIDELCRKFGEGAGAFLITEEALTPPATRRLRDCLATQQPWGDIPIIIFTSQPSVDVARRSFEQLGPRANITLIERPIRVQTLLTAVTAAVRARKRQYEVRNLVGELERRIEERDQFLAMLSHELRNPLAAISLALQGQASDPEMTNERAIIARQTRHLAKLVDDLLDISRVTTGKIGLQRRLVDFGDIVEHCVETMRPRAEARRLRLAAHHPPHVAVFGDPVRLEQLVNNLLSNAIKYTPSGGSVEVGLDAHEDDAVLRVRDSGKGISPEMLPRIFEMFMQGDTTLDRSEGGMGIGLTLVKKLAELHGGSVSAHSSGRGSGSEFVVRIPLEQGAVLPRPRIDVATAANALRRIVIVEDNPDIRDLLRIKLQQLGHEVDDAADGTSGLQMILSSHPEVALIDIGLPEVNGYDVARRLRQELGQSIYLIALTGYGQAEDKRRALDAGFDVHLTKPVDFLDLQNVLRRIPA